MENKTVAEVIATAIRREEEAYFFYMDLHEQAQDEEVKETLEWIAGEEKKHRKFLVGYRDGGYAANGLRMTAVVEYRIAEYLEEPDTEGEMDNTKVYLIAAHREARSHLFYTEMANLHDEGETKQVLLKMANEELRHKEKMEYLYANTAFPQTSGG